MAQDKKKEFTFINEQIKKKPFYRRRWFLQTAAGMALAICFGAAAGIAFSVVHPWAEGQFGEPEKPTQIVVMQEESETEVSSGRQPEISSEKEEESSAGGQTGISDQPRTDESDETEAASEVRNAEMDITEYKKLYEQMKEIAEAASALIVKVSGYSTETDWFNEVYEHMSETSGLILRMDSNWIYVLTSSKVIENAQQIAVTFPNGEVTEASVRKQDLATEMAVLEIPLKNIKKRTRKNLATISMKGVSSVEKGEPVIAVGSPLGYTDSLAFGMITSVTACQSLDNEYRVISTDIAGNENSYGILLNLDGNIVGIISKKFSQDMEQSMVSALRIADMNYLMEMLMEDQPIPYIGIVGREVDAAAAQRFDMPQGVYIRQVEADSPAMHSGIQVADIITTIDGEEIYTVRQYADILRRYREGESMTIMVKRKGMEGYVPAEIRVLVGAR